MPKLVNLFICSIIFSFFIITTPSCSYKNYQEFNADIISSVIISDVKIHEASGVAVSRIHKDVVWIINDGGNNDALIFGVNSKGEHLGTINIQGVRNNDWEDIASFEYKGKPYILIADVGDNSAKRTKYFLHVIQEPDFKKISHISPVLIKPSWSIEFTYEDDPRDCESAAVDIINKKIILLSKETIPLFFMSCL